MRAAAEELTCVLAWAHAHPGTPGDCASWQRALIPPDEDGLDRLGGPGTPAVAEFAVEQLAARLAVSTGSAMGLVADALDLAHRHPVLWGCVQAGACPVWTARRVVSACHALPAEAALWVDERTGHLAGTRAWRTVESTISYAIAKWDPEKTRAAEEQARDGRRLDIDLPGQGGNAADPDKVIAAAHIRGSLSVIDAIKFEALVAAQAAELAATGDTSSLDIRRAKALGVIADQLITGELTFCSAETGVSSATRPAPKSCLPATLYVHVTLEDLLTHLGGTDRVGTVETLGPATLHLLGQWLGETRLSIRPILDLGRTDAVDVHDPPAWMRELVTLRDGHCVFTHCGRDARSCDLDHIDPYVAMDEGGPPGQTRPDHLAPLCRRHHRLKTFTRWRYHRLPDGSYQWTDPQGHRSDVPL